MPISLRYFLFLTLLPRNFAEVAPILNFDVLDLNGLCVFGNTVRSDSLSHEEFDCSTRSCQVAVVIKEVFLRQQDSQNMELVVNISPLGQTLHTLSDVYLNMRYSDYSESLYHLSIFNLNGFHRDLLEKLQILIPLDGEKRFWNPNDTVHLTVWSECSCNKMNDSRYLQLDKLSVSNNFSQNGCYNERSDDVSRFLIHPYMPYMYIVITFCGFCFALALVLAFSIHGQKFENRCFEKNPDFEPQSHGKFHDPDTLEDEFSVKPVRENSFMSSV